MLQVLFYLPLTAGLMPPYGVPVNGFGAALFLCFVLTALVWGPRRVAQIGLPKERLQDMAIVLFVAGIAGARVLYMMQYADQFKGQNLFLAFFQIWNGGIVFYGSVVGGIIGYVVFHRLVLKKLNISTWKLIDAVAPLFALGLAVGRIGCYLNGCCWGQVAVPEAQPVPLVAELGQFPLLPAHAREQLVNPPRKDERLPRIHGLQTSCGFSVEPRSFDRTADPRTVVRMTEPGSEARRAGLLPGDRVVGFNGKPNRIVAEVSSVRQKPEDVDAGVDALKAAGAEVLNAADATGTARVVLPPDKLDGVRFRELGYVSLYTRDEFGDAVRDWPRGENELRLDVERTEDGATVPHTLAFTPRTVACYPTQLYETVNMVLLIGVLLAFQPFRRHDGQVMVLFMLGYAAHRFLNEAIRIEPTYALGLTLSQWISVAIAVAAAGLEVFLRATQVRYGPGPTPLSAGVTPLPADSGRAGGVSPLVPSSGSPGG